MKKTLCVILSLFIASFLLQSCKPKVDVEKEKAAIKAVIDGETQAYADKNSTAIKELYIQDDNQVRAGVSGSNLVVMQGWSKFTPFDSLKFYDYKDVKFKHDFIAIKVVDNFAWAIFTHTWSEVAAGVPNQGKDLQTMVLEKVEGKWKISCFVTANIPPPPPPPPPPPSKK
jgi:hypothetical protein